MASQTSSETVHQQPDYTTYSPGHPWYYVLGGSIPTLDEIHADATQNGYRGYDPDRFAKADKMPEPQRSRLLNQYRDNVNAEIEANQKQYFHIAANLLTMRHKTPWLLPAGTCHSIHQSMALKYCHLYNGFGHLDALDQYPVQSADLFDL